MVKPLLEVYNSQAADSESTQFTPFTLSQNWVSNKNTRSLP